MQGLLLLWVSSGIAPRPSQGAGTVAGESHTEAVVTLRLFVSTSDDSNLPVTHSLISDDFCIAKNSIFSLNICTLVEIFL